MIFYGGLPLKRSGICSSILGHTTFLSDVQMFCKSGLVDRQCRRTCDKFQFFDNKIAVEKLTGLVLVTESLTSPNQNMTEATPVNHVSSLKKFDCNICNLKLESSSEMRDHFKCDWHIFNMNRSLNNLGSLSFRQFEHLMKNKQENKDKIETDSKSTDSSHKDLEIFDPAGESVSDPNKTPSLNASSYKQMLYFRNRCSEIIGIHRCVLFSRKNMPSTMDELLSCVTRARQSRRWAILLYSGGKFAGGIFDGNTEVVHKTMHHYTVRAKQGGSQSNYDSLAGGQGGPKSAGANLRRHGEISIRNEISHLLHNKWRSQLQACQLIFLWSPKVHRSIFFNPPVSSQDHTDLSENTPEFSPTTVDSPDHPTTTPNPDPLAAQACDARLGMVADDPRIRRIPCRSKHITYAHVKELQKELSTFDVYDSHADLDFLTQSGRTQWRKLSENGDETLLETKTGRLIYGPVSLLSSGSSHKPTTASSSSSSESTESTESDDDDDDDDDDDQEQRDEESEQSGSECGLLKTSSQNASSSHRTKLKPDLSSTDPAEMARKQLEDLYLTYHTWHRRLRIAIASGDYDTSKSLLTSSNVTASDQDPNLNQQSEVNLTLQTQDTTPSKSSNIDSTGPSSVETRAKLLNHPLADGRTLLHMAVEFQSDLEVLRLLLESGCDPAIADSDGTTPYQLALRLHKKQMANVFRRFRFYNPDRYDYAKAEIPAPLDPSKEAAKSEKEKERQRKQKQRQKERRAAERAEEERKQQEAEERARFLALSDREKRALAAERRLILSQAQSGIPIQIYSRCFQCACDITGKVPFTYMDYNFCTPACLRKHRAASSTANTAATSKR